MNKTKIEWVKNPDGSQGYTWNPVTGCLNNCSYCYARKFAVRFGENFHKSSSKIHELVEYDGTRLDLKTDFKGDFSLGKLPVGWESPYPFCFEPTLHYYRLCEPLDIKKPNMIFICSMADLFGPWIPNKWIKEIINTVKKAHWHTFIFLTKFPKRYEDFSFPSNCLLGITLDCEDYEKNYKIQYDFFTYKNNKKNLRFISFEPLLGNPHYYLISQIIDWIIIGGLSPKSLHREEWVLDLINRAREEYIPIFIKNNLHWHEKIQEFPKELIK